MTITISNITTTMIMKLSYICSRDIIVNNLKEMFLLSTSTLFSTKKTSQPDPGSSETGRLCRSSTRSRCRKMVLLDMWPLMILLRKVMRAFLLRLQTDSPISMAKSSTMKNTGERVEGKVDNKQFTKKHKGFMLYQKP
jgi:hypothetical protein